MVDKDTPGGTVQIIELPAAQRPDKGAEAHEPHGQRQRDQDSKAHQLAPSPEIARQTCQVP